MSITTKPQTKTSNKKGCKLWNDIHGYAPLKSWVATSVNKVGGGK